VRARKKSLATGSSETRGVVDNREDARRWQLENIGLRMELWMVYAGEDAVADMLAVKETLTW
jgi:hypothetical protein